METTSSSASVARPIPFQKMNGYDTTHVITSLVVPILLIVSASQTLYYGLHPSIGRPVVLTSDFSITLPLLSFGSTGAVSAIFLCIELALFKKVKRGWEKLVPTLVSRFADFVLTTIREGLHPLANWSHGEDYKVKIPKGYELIHYVTEDGVKLGGFYRQQPADCSPANSPTAILFHGNGMCAEGMSILGDYYHKLGFNVLMMEYRGYGVSEGDAGSEGAEFDAIRDVKAAFVFLKTKGHAIDKILVHGYSLGGAYAAMAAEIYDVPTILDHTFTKLSAEIRHLVTGRLLPEGCADQIVAAAYNQEDCRWDTRSRVGQMKKGELFVIRGLEDEIMALKFGDELIESRYKATSKAMKETNLLTITGGHCDGINFIDDKDSEGKLRAFLQKIGFLAKEH